ncbi:MAG: hypothetical protein NTW29_07005 [Bacteroidetes bacterium]|nr:hypothetical protein [Bacteroidota bacterium]
MTGFINQIIQRHTEPAPVIAPRLPGLFEGATATTSVDSSPTMNDTGYLTENTATRPVNEWRPPNAIPVNTEYKHKPDEWNTIPIDSNYEPLAPSPFVLSPNENTKEMPEVINTIIQQEQVQHNYYPVNAEYYTIPATPSRIETVIHKENMTAPVYNDEKTETDPVQPNIPIRIDQESGLKQGKLITDSKNPSPFVLPVMALSHEPVLPVAIPMASQESTTVIKVSIGRIEVKAMAPPASIKKQRSTSATPHMTLEEYLTKRNNSVK